MARRRSAKDTEAQNGWARVPASSVVSVNPQTPVHAGDDSTLVPHFAMEQLDEFRGVLREAVLVPYETCRSGKAKFVDGDVLFAKITPCVQNGKSALVTGLDVRTGFGSSEFYVLRPSRRVLRQFLFYFVRQRRVVQAAVDSFTGTSGRQRVPRTFWDQLEIPVPPRPVQERIVDILRRADEVRCKRQEAMALADAIISATFHRTFGDPLYCGKLHALENGIESIQNGLTRRRKAIENEGRIVLRIQDVGDGEIDYSNVNRIRLTITEERRFTVRPGDMLLVRVNGNRSLVGRNALFHDVSEGVAHNDHLMRIRFRKDRLLPEYVSGFLRTPFGRHELASKVATSAGNHTINQDGIRSLRIPMAPVEDQERFVRVLEQHAQTRRSMTEASFSSACSLDSLLGRAFTGELTAAWEATHHEAIAAQQTLHKRLPQLVLLGFLHEHAKRVAQGGAAASLCLTALMKYAFLLQMEGTAKAQLYHFGPYHYGPFAKGVYADLEGLREQGLVSVESDGEEDPEYDTDDGGLLRVAEAIAPYGSRKPRKVETPRMDIAIADRAAVDRALKDLPADLQEDISAVLDAYGDLGHNALLDAVYEKYPALAKKSRLRKTRKRHHVR